MTKQIIIQAQPGFFAGERIRDKDGGDPTKDTWDWYPVIAWLVEDTGVNGNGEAIPRLHLHPITYGGHWADELPPVKFPDGSCHQIGVYDGPEEGLSAVVDR
jgi:hypothetical protein